VARQDIACKAETNLVGRWFAVESAYQRQAIDADRSGFAEVKAAIEAQDRNAAALIE
jgi:hypothetical protein